MAQPEYHRRRAEAIQSFYGAEVRRPEIFRQLKRNKNMKKRRFFTLMWIPHSQGRIRRMRISKFVFSLGITGAAAALVAFFLLIHSYVQIKEKVSLLDELERVNRIQKVKIFSLAEKVKDFSKTMERLTELEDKLRTLAGVGGSAPGKQASLGKGGPGIYLPPGQESLVGIGGEFIFGRQYPFSYALIGRTEESVNYLEREAKRREEGLGEIEKILLQKKDLFASTPNIFPVQGWISSGFGRRINPFTKKREFHQAIDIVTPWGTEVKAAAQGKVIFAGWLNPYGLAIKVRDGYGYSTVYGHLSRILVKKGSWVSKGEVIGRVGSTGRSTGPHLHFEVWLKGKPINPLNLMVEPLG
jgi:murein DD-endopeptidase MepM/ murein hydrolase activator NlpD